MIAIVVPAHNEENFIVPCLQSLLIASGHERLLDEEIRIFLVLDSCTDKTKELAQGLGVDPIEVVARNVGVARALGAKVALWQGARWLAFTDADTVVSSDWLISQLAMGTDAVCGTVAISDWGVYGDRMRDHFAATYTDRDGHSHIHGANLGVSAQAYERAGGFTALETGEDVALVAALKETGASIAWTAVPRVFTSVRVAYRAPAGFGETLERVERLFRLTPVVGVAT